jgi:hypothetical protein
MISLRNATLEDLFTLANITKEAYGGSALDIETLELLQRYGFENTRTLRHMVKGSLPKRQRKLMYCLARYALG